MRERERDRQRERERDAHSTSGSIHAGVGGTLINLHITSHSSESSITVALKTRWGAGLLHGHTELLTTVRLKWPQSTHMAGSPITGVCHAVHDVLVTVTTSPAVITNTHVGGLQVL